MTQAFIILVKVEETKLDPRKGQHIAATIKELHRATGAHIYQVKNLATLDEWEKELKKVNNL